MVDQFIRFAIQAILVCFVGFIVWYIGNIIIAEMAVDAIFSKVWTIIIGLLVILGILYAAKPFLPS